MVSIKGALLFAAMTTLTASQGVQGIQAAKITTNDNSQNQNQPNQDTIHTQEPQSAPELGEMSQLILPVELTDKNFDHHTQLGTHDTTGPWFIKFYAPWCGHCRRMEQVWNEVATVTSGQLNIGSVDATANRKLAERFEISGYPTLLFFKNKMLYRYNGSRTRNALLKFALQDGYMEITGEPIPKPLTTFDFLRKKFVDFVYDFEAIMTDRPAPAYAIGVSGIFIGISLGALITGILMQKREARKAKKLN